MPFIIQDRARYWNEVVDGQVSSWLETVYLSDSRFPVGAGIVGRKLLVVRYVVFCRSKLSLCVRMHSTEEHMEQRAHLLCPILFERVQQGGFCSDLEYRYQETN